MLLKRFAEQREITAIDNTKLRELLNPRHECAVLHLDYSLAHAVVEPGRATFPHRIKTSSEVYYIIRGSGIMHIDEETASVTANDCVYIPPGARQFIENTDTVPLVFLCIVSPAWKADDEELA
ncbi:MAG: cupin domain-containing protein [Candidatus Thorarchaeota archaeon]|nr:cupin domain-containing protein [Candidatus Thorarchaeota archaeon]